MPKRSSLLKQAILSLVAIIGLWLLMRYCLRLFWTEPYLNLKYDWGYSLFDWRNPWIGSVNAWNDWFLGSSVLVNTGWLVTVLMVVFVNVTGLAATPFLAVLLTALLCIAAVGMAVLLHARGCRWWLAVLFGILYALAPMMFIRVIIGFLYYLIAAALAPWFVWLWMRAVSSERVGAAWFIVPLLAVLISSQPQFVVMIAVVLVLDLVFAPHDYRRRGLWLGVTTVVVLGMVHLPWLATLFRGGAASVAATNDSGGSLSTILAIPHSALRTLFGADHHITFNLIDQLLTHREYALVSLGLVGLAVLAPVLVRKNRLVGVMITALVIAWVMGLGPQLPTGEVFVWVYQHLPFNNIFREVYHWSWLITFSLIVLAGLSLEAIATRLKGVPALIIAALLLFGWLTPWLPGDFYSYITPLELPTGYETIAIPEAEVNTVTNRSLFLPTMGFLIFRDDKNPGAANSDIYGFATNRSQLPFATSLLDFPTRAQEIRNATIMALRTSTAGDFAGYLRATAVDTIFDRPTLKTKFTELFTLPATRRALVNDWQDLRYAPLLQAANGINRVKSYDGVTQYEVERPSALIEYATKEIMAGDDWALLAENSDAAVFFASDTVDNMALRYVGDPADLRAAQLRETNILPYEKGNAVVPTDGWVSKGAVWWWDPALSTIKGSYLFTTSEQKIEQLVTLDQITYTILAKYWSSRWAEELTVTVGDESFVVPTVAAVDGAWRWQELGTVEGYGTAEDVAVGGSGEVGIAQLLIVPSEQLASTKPEVENSSSPKPALDLPFIKKSPSLYTLELNHDEQRTVIARIGYDSGWQLHTADGDIAPTLVDGYAMAFLVPPTQEIAVLEFMPQRTYYALIIGAVLVIGGLLLAAGWFALTKRRPLRT